MFVASLIQASPPAGAAPDPDVTEFVHLSNTRPVAALSPDGWRLVLSGRDGEDLLLRVRELGDDSEREIVVGELYPKDWHRARELEMRNRVRWVGWKSDNRIVFLLATGRLYAIDADGGNRVELLRYTMRDGATERSTFASTVVHSLLPGDPDRILVESSVTQFVGGFNYGYATRYGFFLVDVNTGNASSLTGENTVHMQLFTDRAGRVRGGRDFNVKNGWQEFVIIDPDTRKEEPISRLLGMETALRYGLRSNAANDPFRSATYLGWSYDPDVFYIASREEGDRDAIYSVNLRERKVSEPLVVSDQFDLSEASLVDIPEKGMIAGIRYPGVRMTPVWFASEFNDAQEVIDRLLPGRVNRIDDWDLDLKRFLVGTSSDRDPGSWALVDMDKPTEVKVLWRTSLPPSKFSETLPVWIEARSGKLLSYVTLPKGARPGVPLPMVVLLHGGPWARDIWGFDREVQFLANQGFVVLQVNFRGSSGFGYRHLIELKGKFGPVAQEDVEDAIQWAVGNKLADPRNVNVMGSSYGGYLALYMLGRRPDLFRSGISIAGISDLPDLIEGHDRAGQIDTWLEWLAYDQRRALVGDTKHDRKALRQMSPIYMTDDFKAPVLLIHGEDDYVVTAVHSESMHRRLVKSRKKSELILIKEAGHGTWNESQRRRIYGAIARFLEDPKALADQKD